VLCTADGMLYSVDAWTGSYSAKISTGALLTRSTSSGGGAADSGDDVANGQGDGDIVLPGLDGRLYWQQQPPPPPPPPNRQQRQQQEQQQQPVLQALPLTIHSLLEHPVQSCADGENGDDGDQECGILSATVETSLLAMDGRGRLKWETITSDGGGGGGGGDDTRSNYGGDDDDEGPGAAAAAAAAAASSLLLQRKDYRVQQVSSTTGKQAWNVTLGTWQALDFSEGQEQDPTTTATTTDSDGNDEGFDTDTDWNLPSGDDKGKRNRKHSQQKQDKERPRHHRRINPNDHSDPALPAIVFSNAGRGLVAVHPETMQVLWKMETPSVVASVFGIFQGRWKALQVLLEEDLRDLLRLPSSPSSSPESLFSAFDDSPQRQQSAEEAVHEFLWKQHNAKSTLKWYSQQQQHHRVVDSSDPYSYRRALPGRVDSSSSSEGALTANRQQGSCQVQGECPNLFVAPLGLPSPASAAAAAASAQSQGIFLSWHFVSCLVVLIVIAAIAGRRFYLYKKRLWLQQAAKHSLETNGTVATSAANTTRSMEGVHHREEDSTRRRGTFLTRSMSLPDTLGAFLQQQRRWSIKKSSGGDSSMGSAVNSKEHKSEDTITELLPMATSLAGGIPLVRYSRYASEFDEEGALGKGGFGTVFECRNVLDGRQYAIKKVSIHGDDRSFKQRLDRVLREVKILAVLDHPNIVRYYTAWLELEREDEQGMKHSGRQSASTGGDAGDGDATLSRCYSSSLFTESVSHWGGTRRNHQRPPAQSGTNPQDFNPVGLSLSEDPSFSSIQMRRPLARRPSLEDDCGFIFEDPSAEGAGEGAEEGSEAGDKSRTRANLESTSHTPRMMPEKRVHGETPHADGVDNNLPTSRRTSAVTSDPSSDEAQRMHRHTLYIQMQLCSQKTLQDFLSSRQELDIALSLRFFLQTVQAVQHVHELGLIHRDLKPGNIFLVDGNVKVGDFGLSRESTSSENENLIREEFDEPSVSSNRDGIGCGDDHTAGVGTRSYASPEQMNGSDYDSSTDVYSLGIILFELCYHMTTGMERNICLSRLRQSLFPDDWDSVVGSSFPTLKGLIERMVAEDPSARPSASNVAQHVQSLKNDFTILDELRHRGRSDVLLLRVEAKHGDDALGRTLQAIQEASSSLSTVPPDQAENQREPVKVLQYGLCSADTSEDQPAIMEFALKYGGPGGELVSQLLTRPDIYKVRQVSATNTS